MAKIYGETYNVLTGITDDKAGQSFQTGDKAKLGKPWDVAWLLRIGAIEPADRPQANEDNEENEEDEVADGDRQNE